MLLRDFDAICQLAGSEEYPNLTGQVGFRGVKDGTWVEVEVTGLPAFQSGTPQIGPHGFHIHKGDGSCTTLTVIEKEMLFITNFLLLSERLNNNK